MNGRILSPLQHAASGLAGLIKSTAMNLPLVMFAPLLVMTPPEVFAGTAPASAVYERCVSDAMKGVTSDRAADEARRTCRQRTAGDGVNDVDLPAGALDRLVIHAGFGWGIFSGTLYNGNNDYAITQITVVLTPMKTNDASEATGARKYDLDLAVQPLAKGALSMPVLSDTTLEYSWKITKARGYKIR